MRQRYPLSTIQQVLDCPVYCGSRRISPTDRSILGRRFSGVSSDTRSLEHGNLFIALRGERFDAHDFLDQATDRAIALVIDQPQRIADLATDVPAFLVPDTLLAMDRLAAWYRSTLSARVVAISGSVGKTTTRGMIIAALGSRFRVHGTQANLNNRIGLAQTLFAAPETTEVLVLELGIDQPGDMDRLGTIARPDIAVLTSIGLSHVAHFGSRDAIAREKRALLPHVRPAGSWILNGDEPLLTDLLDAAGDHPVTLISDHEPSRPAHWLYAADIAVTAEGSSFSVFLQSPQPVDRVPELWLADVRLAVPGRHQVRNALFGLAVARELGIDAEQARRGLLDFVVTGDRLRHVECGSVTVISDAYNASLESITAALAYLNTIAGARRRIVAIGGIAELGAHREAVHRAVGQALARHAPDRILLSGPDAEAMEAGLLESDPTLAARCQRFPDRDRLAEALAHTLAAGDIVLLKASRTYAFDALLDVAAAAAAEADA